MLTRFYSLGRKKRRCKRKSKRKSKRRKRSRRKHSRRRFFSRVARRAASSSGDMEPKCKIVRKKIPGSPGYTAALQFVPYINSKGNVKSYASDAWGLIYHGKGKNATKMADMGLKVINQNDPKKAYVDFQGKQILKKLLTKKNCPLNMAEDRPKYNVDWN